ncbi:MAG: hypothetical protein WCJ59_01895 [bacterium]
MGKGNVGSSGVVASTASLSGRIIRNLFAEVNQQGLIVGPIILLFKDESHFTILTDEKVVGVYHLLVDVASNPPTIWGTSLSTLESMEAVPTQGGLDKCRKFMKATCFQNLGFDFLLATANEKDDLFNVPSICFQTGESLLLDVGRKPEVCDPMTDNICKRVIWTPLDRLELIQVEFVLLRNEALISHRR